MRTLILSIDDLRMLVLKVGLHEFMDQLTDRLQDAFAKFDAARIEIPVRTGFYYDRPHTGLIEWMPLFREHESVLMKLVGYHPENPTGNKLPTILSTISVYDSASGHLRALVDGTLITAMRTGAASAVASRCLARAESRTLGLIGCGAQAVTQLHALSRQFDLADMLIYDMNPQVTESFEARVDSIAPSDLAIRPESIPAILAKSDIVCVATAVEVGAGPVFDLTETKPWVHFNAVGSDLPGKTELPLELLQQAFVCADNPEQALQEGECQQLSASGIDAGLVDVCRDPIVVRHVQQQRTVFDSTGWALEDQVAIDLVLEYAVELKIGQQVAIESVPHDPWNPYEFPVKNQKARLIDSSVSARNV